MECPRLRKLTSQAHALGRPLAQNAELFGQSICAIPDENSRQVGGRGQRRARSHAMLCTTNGSETRRSDAHNKLETHKVGMRGTEISGGIERNHRSDGVHRSSIARAQGADIWNH
jgi:hypothetical protein